MFTRILVPLDGSLLAERALPHAEHFARIFGANIIFLQVLAPGAYHENSRVVDPLNWQIRKTEAEVYLQGIVAQTRENLGENSLIGGNNKNSRVDYSIREGKTAESIVDFAHAENIDLLIISTHGSGGLSRWNLGSDIQKVITLICLPVLIVRTFIEPGTEDSTIPYRRILLPMDGSRRAECALPAGIVLGRAGTSPIKTVGAGNSISKPLTENPKLILAEIIKPPEISIPKPYRPEISQISEQLMQINRKVVSNYLYEIKERLPVECETRMVESDGVSSAIHELAGKEDIDLVVLSAHGYNGQFIGPYGTVTRNYIEHGIKPVLVLQDMPRSRLQPASAQIPITTPLGVRYVE